MEFNHTTINQIITDLNKSINEHIIAKDLFFTNCNCNTPSQIGKCFNCRVQEVIDDLNCLKANLEPIAINTINHVQLIDAEAFRSALDNDGAIKSVNCYPVFNNPDAELDYPLIEQPDSFAIDASIERFAMDGNGFHVGYEIVTFQWKAISKRQLEIYGIPLLLSSWVINPLSYEIINKELPFNEEPDTNESHYDNCKFKGQSFDDCNCADNWEGYYQPDDDFFHQEIQSILSMIKYPEATFNADKREWTLGDVSFNLNEFESIQEYKDSCNEDNGMPFID